MAKKADAQARTIDRAPDGHRLFHGAIWHVPKKGAPFECEVPGCEKELGAWRTHNPLADLDDEATAD